MSAPSIHYYDFRLPFLPEVLPEVLQADVLQVSVLPSEPVPLPQAEVLQVPESLRGAAIVYRDSRDDEINLTNDFTIKYY